MGRKKGDVTKHQLAPLVTRVFIQGNLHGATVVVEVELGALPSGCDAPQLDLVERPREQGSQAGNGVEANCSR